MKILYIAYYYPPINSGGTARSKNMVDFLRRSGHEVTVLTHSYDKDKFTNHESIRIYDVSHNKNRKGIRKLQFLLLRCFTQLLNILGVYRTIYTNWLNRIKKKSDKIFNLVNPDLIISSYPPVETLEAGIWFCLKYKIPLICDFRDGLIYEPIEIKRMRGFKIIKTRYEEIEKEAIKLSKAVITASEPISQYFRDEYKKSDIHTILNGFKGDIKAIKERSNNSECLLVHTGQLELSDFGINSSYFFKAVEKFISNFPNYKLKLLFAGNLSKRELKYAKELVKKGVFEYLGFQNHDYIKQLQDSADMLLTITPANKKSMIATKFFEYVKSGKLILGLNKGSEQEKLMKKTKTGVSCSQNNVDEIFNTIKYIMYDNNLNLINDRNVKEIEKLSFENQALKILSVIDLIK